MSASLFLALSISIFYYEVVVSQDDDVLLMYDGQCRDLYEDGICALGERLFLIEGNPQCECDGDEGWLRHEGRCYQEFTPAFCGENEILNLGTRKKLKKGQTYSCVRNPCGANKLGHRQSWENRFCHDVSDIQDVNQCELYPFNPDLDGSPMRCCIPGDRSTCETRFIQPLGLTGSASGCAARKIWSRRFKRCVPLFFG